MKKRFTDEQTVKILQEAGSGGSVRDIYCKHNVTEQTFYRWRKQFDGMEAADVKKLKALHQENEELKKVVAELTLDNRMLRDINSKKC